MPPHTGILELETGSMPLERIRHKWLRSYSGCTDKLFVVTLDDEFLEAVMSVSDPVAQIACCGVLNNIIETPQGDVWKKL